MQTIYPKINFNGDSRETLQDMYIENIFAIDDAIRKVSSNMPNGRNYNKQEYREARRQHEQQVEKLEEAREYMEDILEHLRD